MLVHGLATDSFCNSVESPFKDLTIINRGSLFNPSTQPNTSLFLSSGEHLGIYVQDLDTIIPKSIGFTIIY